MIIVNASLCKEGISFAISATFVQNFMIHSSENCFFIDASDLSNTALLSLSKIRLTGLIILVGAGNMGRALMKYNKWDYVVGEIECAFDINPDRQGVRFGIPVYDIKDLEEKVPEGCRIAILAISENIQQTVDRLIACGITGLVDFTHEHIQIPKGVVLKSVDVVSSIQELVFETNNLNVER